MTKTVKTFLTPAVKVGFNNLLKPNKYSLSEHGNTSFDITLVFDTAVPEEKAFVEFIKDTEKELLKDKTNRSHLLTPVFQLNPRSGQQEDTGQVSFKLSVKNNQPPVFMGKLDNVGDDDALPETDIRREIKPGTIVEVRGLFNYYTKGGEGVSATLLSVGILDEK